MKYKIICKDVYNHNHIKVLGTVDNLEEAKKIQEYYRQEEADLEFYGFKDDNGGYIVEAFIEIEEVY